MNIKNKDRLQMLTTWSSYCNQSQVWSILCIPLCYLPLETPDKYQHGRHKSCCKKELTFHLHSEGSLNKVFKDVENTCVKGSWDERWQFVAEKTEYALSQGLKVCLCVGESLKEREANETMAVVSKQVKAVAGFACFPTRNCAWTILLSKNFQEGSMIVHNSV